MVPKRTARWRRIKDDTLETMAKKENKGLVRKGCKVRQDFINEAKVVVYGKKKYGRVSKTVAGFFGRDDEARVWLDRYGSEVWLLIDGKKNIEAIGEQLREKFGEDDKLYQRLNKFLNTLMDVNLIEFKE